MGFKISLIPLGFIFLCSPWVAETLMFSIGSIQLHKVPVPWLLARAAGSRGLVNCRPCCYSVSSDSVPHLPRCLRYLSLQVLSSHSLD